MAGEKTYTAVISVLDKFSAPILGLEGRLAKLGHVGDETKKHLQMSDSQRLWGQLTDHVGEAHKQFSELGGSIGEVGNRLGEVLPMFGAIGGAASVAGLIEMAHATAEAAEALVNIGRITGETVPQFQAISFAAGQVGVSTDTLSHAFERANLNIGKAALGQNKNVAALFHSLGISIRDANGHIKTIGQILPQLENSFSKTTDPALRSAMAVAIFGRAGQELLPFLTMGADNLDALEKKFSEFGYGFSKEDQEGLEQFNESWKDATLSIQGLTNEIGAKLAPVMAPLLEQFAEWTAKNRDWIALDVSNAIKEVGTDLKSLDIGTVITDATNFGDKLGDVVDKFGGLETVLIAAGGVMAASFLAPVLQVTVAFGKLGLAMGAPILGPVGDLLVDFARLVPLTEGFSGAMAALDLAMDANPLGVLVLAAGAAGAAIYELWTHLKQVEDALDSINTKVQGAAQFLHLIPDDDGTADQAGNPAAPVRYGRLPNLPGAGGGGGGQGGSQRLDVHLHGFPPGTTTVAAASGGALPPVVHKTGMNGTLRRQGPRS